MIILIGLEIVLAVKQGLDEDKLMGKQNGILTQLQQASAATASVMSKMNETIQTQAEEADKVLMEAQMDISLLVLTNRGRPSMPEFGTKLGNSTIMEAQPRTMLSPSIYALELRERLAILRIARKGWSGGTR